MSQTHIEELRLANINLFVCGVVECNELQCGFITSSSPLPLPVPTNQCAIQETCRIAWAECSSSVLAKQGAVLENMLWQWLA